MLNTDYFILLAGNPKAWDEEILAAKAKDRDPKTRNSADADFNLCAMQVHQFGRGRRSAELVKTLYGWSVRSATNLDNRIIIAGGRNNPVLDPREAITLGIQWVEENPAKREFYMRRSDLDHFTVEEREFVRSLSAQVSAGE